MIVIDAVYRNGVFEPLVAVAIADGKAVSLTVHEPEIPEAWREAIANADQFRSVIRFQSGPLPDSTPDIRAGRDHND
jgi:predicted DNA-binding antitoxin AbrB/MazE fold protein